MLASLVISAGVLLIRATVSVLTPWPFGWTVTWPADNMLEISIFARKGATRWHKES